jgi:hypothetical protein
MCLRFKFCTHLRVCILHFLKKVKFVVPNQPLSLDTEQERQESELESLFREQLGKDWEQERLDCEPERRAEGRKGCKLYSQQEQEQERLYTVQSAGAVGKRGCTLYS